MEVYQELDQAGPRRTAVILVRGPASSSNTRDKVVKNIKGLVDCPSFPSSVKRGAHQRRSKRHCACVELLSCRHTLHTVPDLGVDASCTHDNSGMKAMAVAGALDLLHQASSGAFEAGSLSKASASRERQAPCMLSTCTCLPTRHQIDPA